MYENSVQNKRYCLFCGTEVTGDQKFCVNCGHKLPAIASLMSSTNSLHDSATNISKINSAELIDDKSNKLDGMLLAGFILGIRSWVLIFGV